ARRRLVPAGRASALSYPEIIASAYYYDHRDIQALQNLAVGLEMFYTGLSLIPGAGTLKIPFEAVYLGKEIFSLDNGITVATDAAAAFTFGASKLLNPTTIKGIRALQAMRVGAVATLTLGSGFQLYRANTELQQEKYFGAAVDVGIVLVNALLVR